LDLAGGDDVVVVEHEHHVMRDGGEFVEQRYEDHVDRRGRGDCSSARASAPTSGAAVRSAAIR
jgi:hypothetical protein